MSLPNANFIEPFTIENINTKCFFHKKTSLRGLCVEKEPDNLNTFCDSLCQTNTKNVNHITLFNQMEKDMIAIEDFDRYVKAVARGY